MVIGPASLADQFECSSRDYAINLNIQPVGMMVWWTTAER
jgi:hypothetical protein